MGTTALLIALVIVIFIALETVVPLIAAQRRVRAGWQTDVAFGAGNGLLFAVGIGTAITAFGMALRNLLPISVTGTVAHWPLWVQAIVAIALGDLGVYAMHRTEHAVPFLWRFHSVHHAAEEMDFLVAVRNHPIDLLLQRAAGVVPIIALGLSPAALAIYAGAYFWQSFLAHANVRIRYGPLRWLIVSPEFHHWHHANERAAYDHNFAGFCAFWDVCFGTVHLPRKGRRGPDVYGLTEPMPRSYWRLIMHPFTRRASPEGGATRS
jgi:sterol desaturase/sphingolipid hydroxylase (fatty acid hydroxylase superfamily)